MLCSNCIVLIYKFRFIYYIAKVLYTLHIVHVAVLLQRQILEEFALLRSVKRASVINNKDASLLRLSIWSHDSCLMIEVKDSRYRSSLNSPKQNRQFTYASVPLRL